MRDGLEVKLCPGPDGVETFLLCRSADRPRRRRPCTSASPKRIEEALESLERRLSARARRLGPEAIERQIGRLLGRNSRAAGRFTISVDGRLPSPQGSGSSGTQSRVGRLGAPHRRHLHPAHQRHDWSAEELWRTYIQLDRGRGGFPDPQDRPAHPAGLAPEGGAGAGSHPGVLPGLRAVEDAGGMAEAGRARIQSADRLRRIARIQSADVVLPLADDPGPELRLRCVVRPDRAQAMLLDRLGLALPDGSASPHTAGKM